MKRVIQLVLFLVLIKSQITNGITYDFQPAFAIDSLRIAEKLYLHTDRDSYYPGDDIWFKAYLIDASTHLLTGHSNNLHVELISPALEIIDSRIVKLTAGLGNADFHLNEKLKSGRYRIRAYTHYMRNSGEETYFTRDITIINPDYGEKKLQEEIKYTVSRPEISFFPEGGSLVDNVTSLIAFKSSDEHGNGFAVSGEIYSSDKEKVTEFKTTHNGMGIFTMEPVPGTKYHAVIKSRSGEKFRYEIPASFATGIVMNVSKNKPGELLLTFKTNIATLKMILDKDLFLNVSYHKEALKSYSFIMKSLNSFLKIATDDLPEGIVMLTLSDSENIQLCERLVFISDKQDLAIKLETDKKVYGKRDSVSVTLSLSDTTDTNNVAFLSFSATDKLFAENSSPFHSNIASWFLLESDIRGQVEEPLYYFDPANKERFKNLDLLLLTQGWRDFEWKYKNGEYHTENGFSISGRLRKLFLNKPLPGSEVNLGIFTGEKPVFATVPTDSTGRFSLNGIDLTGKARVMASAVGETNKLQGWLLLDSLNYIPAELKDKIVQTRYIPDRDMFISDYQPDDSLQLLTTSFHKFIQYIEIKKSIEKKYKLSDTIQLFEVKVTAKRVDWTETAKSRSRHYLMGTPDKELVITPQLEKFANTYQLLESQMIISPIKVNPRISRNIQNPLYMIDGMRVSKDEVRSLPVGMVERIDVLDNMASYAVFGYRVAATALDTTESGNLDGVVSIILKTGFADIKNPVFHSASIKFSGYDEPRIFYSPGHHTTLESDYKPDLRTTLFWEPDISLEGNKDILLKFYNGDNPAIIKISAEGITSRGIPVTGTSEYIIQ